MNAELRDEVVRLARRHGLPTPFTSYLVLEEQALRRDRTRGAPEPTMAPGDAAAEDAFGFLERKAGEGGATRGARAPAAEADGADAVEEARAAARLRRSDRAELDDEQADARRQAIRAVGARTFYRHDGRWIQSTVGAKTDAQQWVTLDYLSDAYFEFAREHPELGPCLALGEVTFQVGDTVYEVKR